MVFAMIRPISLIAGFFTCSTMATVALSADSAASMRFLFSGLCSKSIENAVSAMNPSIWAPMSTFNKPCACAVSFGAGVACAATSLIERLTGKAGFPPSSRIFSSIVSAISIRSISFLINVRANETVCCAMIPAFLSFSISCEFMRVY